MTGLRIIILKRNLICFLGMYHVILEANKLVSARATTQDIHVQEYIDQILLQPAIHSAKKFLDVYKRPIFTEMLHIRQIKST